uniref:Transcription factor MYBS1 n=1 Tax=Aegilops tauschii subsp. strangulata TaxID=200361 RepID=A0A453FZK8_AEGTS
RDQRPAMDLYYQQAAPAARRPWAKEEDKAFEAALVTLPDQAPDRWERVAARLPGRTPQEAWEHYQALVADVDLIERGAPRGEERRRGIPWSEEEHKLFLDGLEKYGRGDWRNISRFAVRSRTPTQVASHAQKYFIRQANAATRDSKRKSIHDITTP